MLHGGVHPTVTLHTNFGEIEMELLESEAPGTVNNFMNYIEDGDYTNSILHRLVPSFVLQGGGFRVTDPQICDFDCAVDEVNPAAFSTVPTDPPIQNEFGVSNTRGTVAMAKLGGDPDSATNQFFFNLQDNAANLDNQNGGFTVFARVNNMTVVDQIALLPQVNLAGIFPPGPLQAISQAPYEQTESATRLVAIESASGTSVVHGTVFLDKNQNGTRDSGEGGRADVTVYDDLNGNAVRDGDEPATTTNDLGEYHFVAEGNRQFRLRIVDFSDWEVVGQALREGSVNFGRSSGGQDFGTRYTGLSWFNTQRATDVDGVNGLTPLDALLVINELDARLFSDPQTGQLLELTTPLNEPRFVDVNNDGLLSPLDALLVINDLPSTAAASSQAVTSSSRRGHLPVASSFYVRELEAFPQLPHDLALQLLWAP